MTRKSKHVAKNRNARRSLAYRVAFPAWRMMGINVAPEATVEKISRREMENLFSDVLRDKSDPVRLSEAEIMERRQTARMREALLSA